MAQISINVDRGSVEIDMSDGETYFGESKEDVKKQLTKLYNRVCKAIDDLEY